MVHFLWVLLILFIKNTKYNQFLQSYIKAMKFLFGAVFLHRKPLKITPDFAKTISLSLDFFMKRAYL